MDIKTTVSLNQDDREILKSTAESLGISRNQLVYRLLSSALVRHTLKRKDFETVKYQKSKPGFVYRPMPVCLYGVVFEKCMDVRKLFKVSVSRFLAMAIDLYLVMIIRMLTKQQPDTDNYDHVYYIRSKRIHHNMHFSAGHGLPMIIPEY